MVRALAARLGNATSQAVLSDGPMAIGDIDHDGLNHIVAAPQDQEYLTAWVHQGGTTPPAAEPPIL